MNRKIGIPVAALVAAAIIVAMLAGALIAIELSGDDDDDDAVVVTAAAAPDLATGGADDGPTVEADEQPLSPAEVDRVARAALRIAGGGTVTELSRSDDPGEAYEVEVQTDAGEIDIALDENFDRVSNNPYDD